MRFTVNEKKEEERKRESEKQMNASERVNHKEYTKLFD